MKRTFLTCLDKFYEVFLSGSTKLEHCTKLFFFQPGCFIAPFHFHSYNNKGLGGHYRCDTTPEEAEYVAYLKPGNKFCLLDRGVRQITLTDFNVDKTS